MDDYQAVRVNNIPLRIDELNTAVTTLMATAQTTQTSSTPPPPPVYRFAANSVDSIYAMGFTNLISLTKNYVSAWTSASPNFQVMEMYSNNSVCATSGSDPYGACGGIGDVESNFDVAMASANKQMPNPGGANNAGETPLEVLFLVTDGAADEVNSSTCTQPLTGTRCQEPSTPSLCTTIKNQGICIAVL